MQSLRDIHVFGVIMKKLIYAAVMVVLAISVWAHPATNAREKMGLTGPVQELRSTVTDGDLVLHYRYVFEISGELLSSVTEDSKNTYKTTYSYELDANKLVSKINKDIEVYDRDGVLTGTSKEWDTFTYDADGKLTRSNSYKDGKLEIEYWWEDTLMTAKKGFDGYGDMWTIVYEYDENLLLIDEIHYRNKEELVYSVEYENDDRGLPVSVSNWDGQGMLLAEYPISYEFDERGNITAQTNTRDRANGIRTDNSYTYFAD
jgi:YD repeat-containing protein